MRAARAVQRERVLRGRRPADGRTRRPSAARKGNRCYSGDAVPIEPADTCSLSRRGGADTNTLSVYDTGRYFRNRQPPSHLGCFRFDPATAGTLFEPLGHYRSVHECAVRARSGAYDVFGVHSDGVCVVNRSRNALSTALAPAPACDGPYDQSGFLMGTGTVLALYDTDMVLSARPGPP